jgi:outer membrane protein TolC
MPAQLRAQSYTLEACKDSALLNNIDIKNKALDIKASEQVKKAAFTNYFPQVEASAFAYKFSDALLEMNVPAMDLPVYDGNPQNLPIATQFAHFPGMPMSMIEKGNIAMATATQPLYAGRQIANGNKLANIGIEVNEIQLKSIRKEILLETERQYWQIISLYEKKKTLENYITLLDTLHQNVSISVKAGMITRNDLLKVQLQQNELQMNLSKLTNGIELAQMAFCQYTGIEYQSDISFNDQLIIDKNPEQYFINHQDALKNREEYLLLQKSTEAEQYKTKLQRGEFLPQAAVGVGAMHFDIMDDSGSNVGMAFGTISIPISGWWEGKHKMKERKLRETQNTNMVRNTNEQLLLQMQQGYNNLNEAFTQLKLSETSVEQARENLRLNQNNYEAGMINVSDMLEAQAQLQESMDAHTEAMTQYRIAKMHYLRITGR